MKAIAIKEFVRLAEEAEKAFRDGATGRVLEINEYLEQFGYRLVMRNDVLNLQDMSQIKEKI